MTASITVVVPIVDRVDDLAAVVDEYRSALASSGEVEILLVVDGAHRARGAAAALAAGAADVHLVELPQRYGESTCLRVGERQAQGAVVLCAPPYRQIDAGAFPRLIDGLQTADLVVATRDRRDDRRARRVRARALGIVARIAGAERDDLGCGVRAFRRGLLADIDLRGEQHRFLPALAERAGFVVERLAVPQAVDDRRRQRHGPTVYAGRVLDIIAIAFLLRFTQRPFRLFGSIGAALAALGIVLGIALVADKLVWGASLADRPALLLAVLLAVLGVQIAAIGLIAELVVMTRHPDLPTFRIERIVEGGAKAKAHRGRRLDLGVRAPTHRAVSRAGGQTIGEAQRERDDGERRVRIAGGREDRTARDIEV